MTGPIGPLVLARARGRGLTTLLSMGAVAAAVALVAILAGIGAIATDRTLARALASEGADRPVVRISHFSNSGEDRQAVSARVDALSEPLAAHAAQPVRGVLIRELTDREAPIFELLVAVDEPAPWTTVLEGRLPEPCTPTRCEVLLASAVSAPAGWTTARPVEGLDLPIVGRGLLDPAVPFERLDQSGAAGERPANDSQTERRAPAILLVNGVDALAGIPALDRTGRTYVWTAALRPDAIHAWTVDDFMARLSSLTRRLTDDDSAFTISGPAGRIDDELDRAEAARGRLLLIGSLAVSILLAFAVFAALVGRPNVMAEAERLRAVGARRWEVAVFLVLEAALPVGVGAAIGVVAGVIVVAAQAASHGAPVGPLLADALLAPGTLTAAAAVLLLALVATAAATIPSRGQGAPRTLGLIGLTAVVLLGWQLATSGALEPTALARSIANPAIVVVPSALAFLVALVFLAVLPVLFRRLARRLRRAPLGLRLSILSVSREPARPAATVTLLAFSLGAIVFALGWSASLRQGIVDQAAYRSGLDLRVTELGTAESISQSVVPVTRYAGLGGDVTTMPVFRGRADVASVAGVTVLGVDPSLLPTLPGWRSDFSDRPVTELAAALEVPTPAGGWRQAGHLLPADKPDLELEFEYHGEPLRLAAVVETSGADHASIRLGAITEGMTRVRAPLPPAAIGGTLIALNFTHERFIYGPHQHELRRATVTFHGLDGLIDAVPIDLEIFTVAVETIRAPQATDGTVLPALVSTDLAAAVDPDGRLRLNIGGGATIDLKVIGTATSFPTVVEDRPQFAVVALQPWLAALNAEAPGAGRPTEMWIGTPGPERLATVRAALASAPFRFPVITDQAAVIADRTADPLSESIVWALVVAALAGLILSVAGILLGAAADLSDESGELTDLEAQGVAPSTLRAHAVLRTAWLAAGGAIAGVVVGALLAATITVNLAVTAEGTLPIPPMRIVLPIGPVFAGMVALLAAVLGVVGWMARRRYRIVPAGGGGPLLHTEIEARPATGTSPDA